MCVFILLCPFGFTWVQGVCLLESVCGSGVCFQESSPDKLLPLLPLLNLSNYDVDTVNFAPDSASPTSGAGGISHRHTAATQAQSIKHASHPRRWGIHLFSDSYLAHHRSHMSSVDYLLRFDGTLFAFRPPLNGCKEIEHISLSYNRLRL